MLQSEQIENIIKSRPRSFGWFTLQKIWLIIFIIVGCVFFSIFLWQLLTYMTQIVFIEASIENLQQQLKISKETSTIIIEQLIKRGAIFSIVESFFLSIFSFIIARYCKKVINRNRYIIKMERELKNNRI
ncbi:MAG: hypothetical protein CVU05_11800 [Bacteroidetes bacterium HGW-Bacteroidetes-21]|jgi:hypothetical protein|nr:MAG: hypothetical protein CVU05_11800 [Bacteroidetes bacterium HGW-Bacteroidetes-21]